MNLGKIRTLFVKSAFSSMIPRRLWRCRWGTSWSLI